MITLTVKASSQFSKTYSTIASDKSISHRCALFSLLSDKTSVIDNFLLAEDTLCSLAITEKLGAKVIRKESHVTIVPSLTLQEPTEVLDCGNSGTSIRLYTGFLAAQEGFFVLTGDKYLCKRPMKRILEPLKSIGASIDGRSEGNLAPLAIRGKKLDGFNYQSPISSAQVKSALILAGLFAKSPSFFSETELSRDHTERMLQGMGAELKIADDGIIITPLKQPLQPLHIRVPADPSSAFFFAVAAAITPHSCVVLKNVLLNKTRIEAFKVLEQMGTKITYQVTESQYEDIGDITVEYAPLKAVHIHENISWLIDELPALAIAMACASGISRVSNAQELRVKESDRITTVMQGLMKSGIETKEYSDGYEIVGGTLQEALIDSHGDHRIAMSFLIAGLRCGMHVKDVECIQTSFPNFITLLEEITQVDSSAD